MAARTYLYGYKGARRTSATIDTYWQVSALHPEFRRRVWSLCDAALDDGFDLGIGGGTRTYAQQAALYKARNGIGVAPAGLSYHEEEATPLGAIAVDLVGDLEYNLAHAHEHGLIHFHDLSEDWHDQPFDVPRARRTYKLNPTAYPILRFPLPGNPPSPPAVPPPKPPVSLPPVETPVPTVPRPPEREDDMQTRYLARLDTNSAHLRRGDGLLAEVMRSQEVAKLKERFDAGIHAGQPVIRYYNPHNDTLINEWRDIPVLTETQLDLDVGYLSRHAPADEG